MLCPPMPTAAFPHDHRAAAQPPARCGRQQLPYNDQIVWASMATLTGLPATPRRTAARRRDCRSACRSSAATSKTAPRSPSPGSSNANSAASPHPRTSSGMVSLRAGRIGRRGNLRAERRVDRDCFVAFRRLAMTARGGALSGPAPPSVRAIRGGRGRSSLIDRLAGEHALDDLEAGCRDRRRVHAVFEEGGVSHWHPALQRLRASPRHRRGFRIGRAGRRAG